MKIHENPSADDVSGGGAGRTTHMTTTIQHASVHRPLLLRPLLLLLPLVLLLLLLPLVLLLCMGGALWGALWGGPSRVARIEAAHAKFRPFRDPRKHYKHNRNQRTLLHATAR